MVSPLLTRWSYCTLALSHWYDIAGLMRKRCNSIADALELHLFCIKSLIWCMTAKSVVATLLFNSLESANRRACRARFALRLSSAGSGWQCAPSGSSSNASSTSFIADWCKSVLAFAFSDAAKRYLLRFPGSAGWMCAWGPAVKVSPFWRTVAGQRWTLFLMLHDQEVDVTERWKDIETISILSILDLLQRV